MPDDSFILRAGGSSARFFALGAECRAWSVNGNARLWSGEADIWPGVSPLLFPTCGWSRGGAIRIGDTRYDMPVHGFAAQSHFVPTQTRDDEICFSLCDDAATRGFYPFAFRLSVTWRLTAQSLHAEIGVENRGDDPMPYACGLHPGFVWRHGDGSHRFVFGAQERAEVPIIAPGGLFSPRRRPVPLKSCQLDLIPDLFAAEALCFLDTKSRSFSFEGPKGRLTIDAPDFPHLVLWNKESAPFIAIESWTGTGDLEGFEGDFHTRPSMIHLAAGAMRRHRLCYTWQELGTGGTSP